MQFHLNGFRPGNPLHLEASALARPHTDAVPEQVDVLIVGCGPAGLTLAALALIAAVGSLAYNRIFTQALAAPGLVVQDGMTLTATAAGQVDYVNTAAAKGEVAYTIRASSGEMLSIAMPCDCSATVLAATVGATVNAGQPMLSVHTADAPVVFETALDADHPHALTYLTIDAAAGSSLTVVQVVRGDAEGGVSANLTRIRAAACSFGAGAAAGQPCPPLERRCH